MTITNTTSNKSSGDKFEVRLAQILADNGFWVHRFAPNAFGQPADIIAVKTEFPNLIDCKVCKHDSFALSRVEPNQEFAMTKWESCKNSTPWFAMETSEGIYMMSYRSIHQLKYRDGQSVIGLKQMKSVGMSLTNWMEVMTR